MTSTVTQIRKRTGEIVPFNPDKIADAIFKAARSVGGKDRSIAEALTVKIVRHIEQTYVGGKQPSVEEIQDIVEKFLIEEGHAATAKAYILYRNDRARMRENTKNVPTDVKELVDASKKYFKNQLGEFVYYRTYSRWIPEKDRRETWIETVDRYVAFMRENLGDKLTAQEYNDVRNAILEQKVMPSMRLLQFAGDAARKYNICAYNCSFIAPSSLRDFAEIMFILMCGSGVGFSVEQKTVDLLPTIVEQTGEMLPTHVVADSKEGWADAMTLGMETWFAGKDVRFDYSKIRPAGARLSIMGGHASGPDPLISLLEFARKIVLSRQGKKLRTIDVHDIVCKVGEVVVAGGVRRSALISLSDLNDKDMRDAKVGQFYLKDPQRSMSNNSAVYNDKPSVQEFLEEWTALVKSGSGERGIFNREALKKHLPERRLKALNNDVSLLGTNPCGEIILQHKQFCNLTEIVARPEDTKETLLEKARIGALIGTYQASLTNFPYLSKEWKEHCEQERLLGVGITGQWDCPAVRNAETLEAMREKTLEANREYAKRFGIGESTCITTVKPSGNISQTVSAASGLHPRYSKYYIRRVRIMKTDPLFHLLRDQKVPNHPEVGYGVGDATTFVVEFPVKSPEGSVYRTDLTAIDQLEYWKILKLHYTEHNPSITVYVGEDEWLKVGTWIYDNWEFVGGISFLPRDNHVYALAPYEEITEERYNEMMKTFPNIDFSDLVVYEAEDKTDRKAELACVGGACEL